MADMIYTIANTQFFISEDPMDPNFDVVESDFSTVVWVEVEGLYNLGELGGEQGVNEFELINSDWMLSSKGTRNGGTMTNTFVPIPNDPGQIKFQEAIEDNCNVYGFQIVRGADCFDGEGAPDGMTQQFQGFALDGVRSGGTRNDLYTRTFSVRVYGTIVEI